MGFLRGDPCLASSASSARPIALPPSRATTVWIVGWPESLNRNKGTTETKEQANLWATECLTAYLVHYHFNRPPRHRAGDGVFLLLELHATGVEGGFVDRDVMGGVPWEGFSLTDPFGKGGEFGVVAAGRDRQGDLLGAFRIRAP